MKIYSWEMINLVLVFPGIFATTLVVEGVYKLTRANWLGILSLSAGIFIFIGLIISYLFFTNAR